MDELTLVREWGADQGGPSGRSRAAARSRLEAAMAEESRGVASREGTLSRRLVFRTAFVGVTAAAVGAAVVMADDDEKENTPRLSTVSAMEVLRRAADRSRSVGSELPVPRDDQYFYTRTHITRTPVKGGQTRTWTNEAWISVDGSRPSRREEYGKVHNDPPLGEHEVLWPPTTYSALQEMPTDPDKLLDLLRLGQGSSPQSDRMAFFEGCMLLKGPRVMPPGLQAAALDALSKLPRIRLNHDDVDIAGRGAVGVSYPEADFTFLFDRETYDYLGQRVKGSVPKKVNGEWKQTGWYYETRSLRDLQVVDRIGQRR
ncbi:CU044_5270 family protein [Streptomyces sp. NPDC006385]|uniref:CU044_5270 family protein n=1 Tax=Streptomyces sp. NPDC006385 TaxID=3156761 RepID=UPI0033BA82F5